MFRELARILTAAAGEPVLVIDDVAPNPDVARLAEQVRRFRALRTTPEIIVAIGGGSVIDSAKVFAAAGGDFAAVRQFLQSRQGGERLACTPLIAVPTTAGTGSEVTCWATVWDADAGAKTRWRCPGSIHGTPSSIPS